MAAIPAPPRATTIPTPTRIPALPGTRTCSSNTSRTRRRRSRAPRWCSPVSRTRPRPTTSGPMSPRSTRTASRSEVIGGSARTHPPPQGKGAKHGSAALSQRVHDHRPGHRGRRSGQERRQLVFDPRQRALVGFLGGGEIVEQADGYHGVVGCVDHVIAHEALDLADEGYRALLDPARKFFGL